ncbi:recombination protein NinG [Acidovorax sp. LjRoot74]
MTFRRTRCPHCKGKMDQGVRIHPECIDAYAEAEEAKAKRKAEKQARASAKVEKAEDRRRKEAAKRIPELIAEAQAAFNAYIRARDEGQPCICCGKPFEPMKPGGSVDAGHFRSRGAAGHLRFNEDNCFAQRKNCNRPGGATYAAFRAGVVARIGEERVAALEADNTPCKWMHDQLRAIRDTYRAKLKELRK